MNSGFLNGNYLPYSVGLLQAYAQRFASDPSQFEFIPPLYRRMPVDAAAERLLGSHVVGFSVYAWNYKLSLELARVFRLQNPDAVIVFGGPHVPDRAEDFLREHPYIDIACHGEGESVFLSILEQFHTRCWDHIPSISIIKNGAFVHHLKGSRIKDLAVIPSPYLEGVFVPLLEANPTEKWIGLWETNRGCPFSCTFCDWGSATAAKIYKYDLDRVYQELEWFATHKVEFLFCCDANFGILARDLEIATYLAATKKKFGYPQVINVATTKNATERSYQVQKVMSDAGLLRGATLAMQSMDPATLKNIKRDNISLDSYKELHRRFTDDGIGTYSELIIGLPGETYQSFLTGVSDIVEHGQHNRISCHNLSILPNAEVGDPAYQKKHGMVLMESAIINSHGYLTEAEDGIQETQQLVIATNTMPREDWCKTRVLCWMVQLLHFDKLLQIPLIVLREVGAFGYEELFRMFLDRDLSAYPLLLEIRNYFWDVARQIQRGGDEYCHSPEWLGIWWQADEYMFIKICVEGKLDAFYQEAEGFLREAADEKSADCGDILHAAGFLNKCLLRQPFQTEDLDIELPYNLWEVYEGARRSKKVPLESGPHRYHIDRTSGTLSSWNDWYRDVVWFGSRQGAYLHKRITVIPPSPSTLPAERYSSVGAPGSASHPSRHVMAGRSTPNDPAARVTTTLVHNRASNMKSEGADLS
jgi:tRNA A37 methylthiotransferase MiaB